MKHSRVARLRAVPLLLAVFGIGSALALAPTVPVAHAQGLPSTVGVVDEDKLADSYKAYQTAISDLDKRAQSLDARIPAREYLNEVDGKNFDALIVSPTLTPAQQTQLDALVTTGSNNKAEYIGLAGNPNRTAKDNARLKELQDTAARNASGLQLLSQNLLEAIRKQQDETDKTYTDRANSIVVTIAGEKKLVAVLRKKALVWSADNVDITDEVLKRLNGTK